MTRIEPLTSLALGRSPYDEVVEGTGEESSHTPQQLYDERGRPYNPEAKRLNRDLIRAHNEVMLAIGVAEPEDGGAERESQQSGLFKIEANVIGSRLWNVGRVIEVAGVWGIHGLRNRILVYKQYSQIPFADLYHYERSRRSMTSLALSSFPTFVAETSLRMLPLSGSHLVENLWVKAAVQHVRLHLQLFIFLQRIEVLSPNAWFPSLKFFIPFSKSSPIPPPPPLRSLSPRGILQWLGGVALSAAPIAAFWVYLRVSAMARMWIWPRIFHFLPNPLNYPNPYAWPPPALPPPAADPADQQPAPTGVASLADTRATDSSAPPNNGQQQITDGGEEPSGGDENPAASGMRRQSTFSSARGDEYASDEDDTERVNIATISFDVETTEVTDAHPGVWSAELRPSPLPAFTFPPAPLYIDNALTRLPASLAADILTIVSSNVLMAPFEAFSLRALAWSSRRRLGLPVGDVYDVNPLRGFSWTAFGNLLQLEMVHLIIQGEIWSAMILWADSYTKTPSTSES